MLARLVGNDGRVWQELDVPDCTRFVEIPVMPTVSADDFTRPIQIDDWDDYGPVVRRLQSGMKRFELRLVKDGVGTFVEAK